MPQPQWSHDLRLLLPAGCAWLCVVFVLVLHTWLVIIALGMTITTGMVFLRLRFGVIANGVILLLFLTSIVAVLSAGWQVSQRYHPAVDAQIAEVESASFMVSISGYCRPASQGSTLRCPVEAQSGLNEHSPIFRAIAQFPETDGQIRIGEYYLVQARAQRIDEPRPQAYRLQIQRIEQRFPGNVVTDALNQVRLQLLEHVAGLPGGGAQLIPGVAIGDTILVDPALDEAMKTSSLSHLTAVSGSNFAMVVMALLFLGGLFGWSRLSRSLFAFAGLVAFMILVTPEPSVLRASAMATIALTASNLGRRGAAGSALSVTVLVLLVVDPWLALEFGFILSVSATAGLLYLSTPIADRLTRWIPRSASMALSIPLAAQLACQPALILLQDGIPSYGVIANLLVSAASPLATGLGLVAGLLLPILPWLGIVLLWLAWIPATWIALVAEFFAAMPLARLIWFDGALGALLAAVLLLLVIVALLVRRAAVRQSIMQIAVVFLVCTGASLLGTMTGVRMLPPDWSLAFCDVGQGDAIVLRSSGETALIDTGPDPQKLTECLSLLGVQRLELVVITHFDQDHSGGLAALQNIEVAHLLHSGEPEDLTVLRGLPRVQNIHRAAAGMTGSLGTSSWRVLWPEPEGFFSDRNQRSVVMRFQGNLSFLSLGDLNEQSQLRLLAHYRESLHSQVVKVAHHGSRDQSAQLYEWVRAAVAVFTVGENRYGHPHPDTLNLFPDALVLRTDLHGLILLAPGSKFNGVEPALMNVWTER